MLRCTIQRIICSAVYWRVNLITISKPFKVQYFFSGLNFPYWKVTVLLPRLILLWSWKSTEKAYKLNMLLSSGDTACFSLHVTSDAEATATANWSYRDILADTSSTSTSPGREPVGENETKCPVCHFQSSIPPSPLLWKLWVEASWRLKMLYRYKDQLVCPINDQLCSQPRPPGWFKKQGLWVSLIICLFLNHYLKINLWILVNTLLYI